MDTSGTYPRATGQYAGHTYICSLVNENGIPNGEHAFGVGHVANAPYALYYARAIDLPLDTAARTVFPWENGRAKQADMGHVNREGTLSDHGLLMFFPRGETLERMFDELLDD